MPLTPAERTGLVILQDKIGTALDAIRADISGLQDQIDIAEASVADKNSKVNQLTNAKTAAQTILDIDDEGAI